MKRIFVDIPRIGDSICALFFLKHWADIDGHVIYGPKLNAWVSDNLPRQFVYDPAITKDTADFSFDFSMTTGNEVWECAIQRQQDDPHLIDAFFLHSNVARKSKCYSFLFPVLSNTETADIVISPFASVVEDNKMWTWQKWRDLIDSLPRSMSKCVIGGANDDYSWVPSRSDVRIARNKTLPYVSALLKKCKLFVSIDTGTSHLAHVLGVAHHVLLYPHPWNLGLVENTNARDYKVPLDGVKWKRIADIPVSVVQEMCYRVLDRR